MTPHTRAAMSFFRLAGGIAAFAILVLAASEAMHGVYCWHEGRRQGW